jgi:hypothetical protein
MPCTCPPNKKSTVECGDGVYCRLCGVQVHAAPEVLYSNPSSVDMFARRSGGIHWACNKPRRGAVTGAAKGSIIRSRVDSVLRQIFYGPAYERVQSALQADIKNCINGHFRDKSPTFFNIAATQRNLCAAYPPHETARLSVNDPRFDRLVTSLSKYYADHKDGLEVKAFKAYVASMLTLLVYKDHKTSALSKMIPPLPWLKHHLPPPQAMTALGIPCRSVSRGVRAIKVYVLGKDHTGVPGREFVYR